MGYSIANSNWPYIPPDNWESRAKAVLGVWDALRMHNVPERQAIDSILSFGARLSVIMSSLTIFSRSILDQMA